ncbi:MAG: flagellar motor protein MotB [Thermodesulfobacteriota bacterium]
MKASRVIIKKVRKKGPDSGRHGGEWKVAYADFVTAMMAFFLLMWLIAILSPETKKSMAHYFQEVSIFQNNGSGFLDKSNGIMGDAGAPQVLSQGREVSVMSREEFRDRLKRDIETKLAEVKDQILVEIFEGGVRIQMIDKEGSPMFALGSPALTETARKIIRVIASNIRNMGNDVAIEGHTDALTYASNRYTNWELSTERASSARKELETEGLHADRLIRVAGYAAKEPLIKTNPADPRNRRISVVLLFNPAKEKQATTSGQNPAFSTMGDFEKVKPIHPLGTAS